MPDLSQRGRRNVQPLPVQGERPCELCKFRYRVTYATWAKLLNNGIIQAGLHHLSDRGLLDLCGESLDSFRFVIVMFGHDLGYLFGGVIMAKTFVIIFQLFKQDRPEVQNMVGFLAFIVFLVQSRVFSPGTDGSDRKEMAEGNSDIMKEFKLLQHYAPHYFLVVYAATTTKWYFSIVQELAARAMRTATVVEEYRKE
ncbi:hypothetical protein GUITHDRAFT_135528 [Guillardia theta CCMP2712]|uniref:Uncharacterized protein n=1 Tax=Guillardia theta (strain CCMP2712) TaxID=905079 RepID=L1JNR8_GUITC|nr:hypothetical protein GUITHDRAFT_135528 [Guillardia theta CCMP2712]EKX49815.1 hypothetical protein GUITHDRAFT_135528 [Guillardia theta CCMP2712]|eukprot:XP_005836795.1 hypothetical protein GUITHDRAFT_135528 [Guillardia theta CCMP2712]